MAIKLLYSSIIRARRRTACTADAKLRPIRNEIVHDTNRVFVLNKKRLQKGTKPLKPYVDMKTEDKRILLSEIVQSLASDTSITSHNTVRDLEEEFVHIARQYYENSQKFEGGLSAALQSSVQPIDILAMQSITWMIQLCHEHTNTTGSKVNRVIRNATMHTTYLSKEGIKALEIKIRRAIY